MPSMPARPASACGEPRRSDPTRGTSGDTHPATVTLANGSTENFGVHAWRVLLDMADPMAPPPSANYGLHPHQRDNIRESLTGMTQRERCQLLSSFLHMLQLLISEVAAVLDETLRNDDVEVEVEGDEATFMHRFLLKPGDTANTNEGTSSSSKSPSANAETNEDTVKALLGDPYEMEVRALVSALELGERMPAVQRARGLLERVKLQFGVRLIPRANVPRRIEWLESALVTFLPGGYEDDDSDYLFQQLRLEDRDFIDFWWRLLYRSSRST